MNVASLILLHEVNFLGLKSNIWDKHDYNSLTFPTIYCKLT
jgi:hypothetical protein